MGGIGSGSSRSSRFLTVEQCYDLDLADLARAGFVSHPGYAVTGPWSWTTNGGHRDGEETTVQVRIDRRVKGPEDPDAPARFAIFYGANREPAEDAPAVRGELLTTAPALGGIRFWWRCPQCWRRARVLYAYPAKGRERFACRRCQNLRYYSSNESPAYRALRRGRKFYRRVGSVDDLEPWQKPRWMRWPTFSRLVLAGRHYTNAADRMILAGMDKALVYPGGPRAPAVTVLALAREKRLRGACGLSMPKPHG
jgi:hypothetical protein